jgi:hypothetical protein
MKLNLAHQLLVAADEQMYGFLRVRGPELAYEVELLTEAGLVESSIDRAGAEPVAVIKRVTVVGHDFMRAFGGERRTPHPSGSSARAYA